MSEQTNQAKKQPNMIEKVCQHCGKKYAYNEKKHHPKYLDAGCCSYQCAKESGVVFLIKMKTSLDNAGIEYDESNIDDIKEKYSAYQSKQTEKAYDKWLKTHLERYGNDVFVKRGEVSEINKLKKFLLENKIVESCDGMTKDEMKKLYNENFNNITHHGEKIKQGILKVCDNNPEKVKNRFRAGMTKFITHKMIEEYGEEKVSQLTEEEYENLYALLYKKYLYDYKTGKKTKEELLQWKKTHLINHGIDASKVNSLSDEEVEKLYSEYLSERFPKLDDNLYCGYKRTKKGWYHFKSSNNPFFYRSGWEEEVCKVLDGEIGKTIKSVSSPDKIMYEFEGQKHAYYADFKIEFMNGDVLYIEVKPEKRVNDPVNQAKIQEAKKQYDHFIVLSESSIFAKNLLDIIKNFKDHEQN